ncbi:MAG: sirohydrochlorin chelatase [Leptolyngbyaceae cyanobacterium]
MTHSSAYLLVFHGSSDPRPEQSAHQLARFFAERIQYRGQGSEIVGVAALESHPLALHQQIQYFCQQHDLYHSKFSTALASTVTLLPLFLFQGVHVMEDIPAEVVLAQQTLEPAVKLGVSPPLGYHPGLQRLIQERMAGQPMEAWILLAHGSRRPGANQDIEMLADRLGAIPAFWAVSSDLETRLQELAGLGLRRVGIFPYFLFMGRTTDAIAQRVRALTQQFPDLSLTLEIPLTASPDLADFLVELAQVPAGVEGE